MAKIKFERVSAPTGSIEFNRNPSGKDYSRKTAYLQPKDLSDGGDYYSYDKGISAKNTRRLYWGNISKTDYDNFITFLGVVAGFKYNFTFTDYDGSSYTARILNSDNIESGPVGTNRESLTVELLIES
jgi:hypothetical protein